MTSKREHGKGSVKTVRDRDGEIIGYQALLPRELSTPPRGCKNRSSYQEPVGERQDSFELAERLLIASIAELRLRPPAIRGLSFSHFVAAEIEAKKKHAWRKYKNDARVNRYVATWKSIDKTWLKPAPFYDLAAADITTEFDLQPYVRHLTEEAETHRGDPLSADFVHNVARFLRSVFARAGVKPNPARDIELPSKNTPKVPYLEIGSQRRFFGNQVAKPEDQIDLEDRVMVGCGMGAGLRIGELLSIEVSDVHLDDHDPHLVIRYGGPDRAPTKGEEVRVVELFEPGLGFWRRWMRDHHRGGDLVFAGPRGGYQKHWQDNFPGWAAVAGVRHMSSHIMRHTYAVAILSGSWGYEPKSLEFVQKQLGHAERSTTERYYGAFERSTWKREVRLMTGRDPAGRRTPVTADELLGIEGSVEGSGSAENTGEAEKMPVQKVIGLRPRQSPKHHEIAEKRPEQSGLLEATPQSLVERIDAVLASFRDGDPVAAPRAILALADARAFLADLSARWADDPPVRWRQ
jgi:integrase